MASFSNIIVLKNFVASLINLFYYISYRNIFLSWLIFWKLYETFYQKNFLHIPENHYCGNPVFDLYLHFFFPERRTLAGIIYTGKT